MSESNSEIVPLLKEVWAKRKLFIKVTSTFLIFGLVVALLSPKEFSSNTIILPQDLTGSSSASGGLGGLASLAGVNLGSRSEAIISPDLYPQLVSSTPFKKKLLSSYVKSSTTPELITLQDYFLEEFRPGVLHSIKEYTLGLPYKIVASVRSTSDAGVSIINDDSELEVISSDEFDLFQKLDEIITVNINKIDGYVTIGCSMPTAHLAAEVTRNVQVLLQQEIINIKLDKLKDHMIYIESRYAERKLESEEAQAELANYVDRNIGNNTATSLIEKSRLQSEFNLAFSVYQELAKQRETHALKIKETTPIFTVIEPVSVPYRKSAPRRGLLVVSYTIIGIMLSFGLILLLIFRVRFMSLWEAS